MKKCLISSLLVAALGSGCNENSKESNQLNDLNKIIKLEVNLHGVWRATELKCVNPDGSFDIESNPNAKLKLLTFSTVHYQSGAILECHISNHFDYEYLEKEYMSDRQTVEVLYFFKLDLMSSMIPTACTDGEELRKLERLSKIESLYYKEKAQELKIRYASNCCLTFVRN